MSIYDAHPGPTAQIQWKSNFLKVGLARRNLSEWPKQDFKLDHCINSIRNLTNSAFYLIPILLRIIINNFYQLRQFAVSFDQGGVISATPLQNTAG
jgi:hypothetical protein